MVISPMLAESVSDPGLIDWGNWVAELKLDGVRCIAYLDGETRLWGRHGTELTDKFPELQGIHLCVTKPCVLDGEIACQTFEQIQRRVHKGKPLDIRIASKMMPATYEVFDILYLDREGLTKKPLMERKVILEETLDFNLNIRPVLYFIDGVHLFNWVREQGLEGIMAKRMRSAYQQGKRSRDWLKIKCLTEQIFLVSGTTKGNGDRASTFGSLILGEFNGSELNFVGCVGSGFTEENLKRILSLLKPLKSECPFKTKPPVEVQFWTKPVIACEVRFLEKNPLLRFPTFRKLANVQAIRYNTR